MKMNINELGVYSKSTYGSSKYNLTPRVRGLAMGVVVAIAAVTFGVADKALAVESPPGCTTNGLGAAISYVKLAGALTSIHGNEICFQVEIYNFCGSCCDVTGLNSEIVLPNGSIVPITVNASVARFDDFVCPSADPRCVTASNCTIPGQVGYRYIVAHADEHGETGTACPPTPAAGSGQVSAFLRSTAGTVHLFNPVGANLCNAIAITVPHACCEPCAGTCTEVASANDCPFPSVFTPDKSCAEVTCAPLDCSGFVTNCYDARCNTGTGLCEQVPKPLSTPCEADKNLCTIDHCDGNGECVFLDNVFCPDPTGECDGGSHCETDTGNCVEDPDPPISTPCNTDDNLCTGEHCDGLGSCVPFPGYDVICSPAIPPCEGGELCDPATGLCVVQPDAVLSTPCQADADLCTVDHCDGAGACVTFDNVVCPGPVPPCEGGQHCVPTTGLCVDDPDAVLSTPCEADGDLCTIEHCDGLGQCVHLSDVVCQAPNPPCEGGEQCNPTTGACDPNADAPIGTPCETDTDPCTNQQCDGNGLCVVFGIKCGACCDTLNGVCSEGIPEADCVGDQRVWTGGAACAEVTCEPEPGACCDQDAFGACTMTTAMACDCEKCVWHKLQTCDQIECVHNSIPTMSQWGLAVLTLLLLIGAKVYFGRRQADTA